MSIRNILKTSLTIASLVTTVPAFAQTAPSDAITTVQNVRYDDLDLRTDAGVLTLQQRIRIAAHEVCGADGGFSSGLGDTYSACVKAAVKNAQQKLETVVASLRNDRRFAMTGPEH